MLNRTKTNSTTKRNLGIEQVEGRNLMAADLVMGAIESPITAETSVQSEVMADEVLMPNFEALSDGNQAESSSKHDKSDYIQDLLAEAMRYMQEREADLWATIEQNLSDPDGDGVDDNHGFNRSTSEQLQDRLDEVMRYIQEREEELWATIEQNLRDPDGDGIDDNHGIQRSSSSDEIQGRLAEALRYMQEREAELAATIEQNLRDPDGDGADYNHGFYRSSTSTSDEIKDRMDEALRYMQEREEALWATIEQNLRDPDGDGIDYNHGFYRNKDWPAI